MGVPLSPRGLDIVLALVLQRAFQYCGSNGVRHAGLFDPYEINLGCPRGIAFHFSSDAAE